MGIVAAVAVFLVSAACYRLAQDDMHKGRMGAEIICTMSGAMCIVMFGTVVFDLIMTGFAMVNPQ